MKVVVLGAQGQLGTDVSNIFKDEDAVSLSRDDLDITDQEKAKKVLRDLQPDIVINTAAYHNVEECESNINIAFEVNTIAAHHLSIICRDLKARFVYISTDYVFDGQKNSPYTEDDASCPLNAYGVSKFIGELLVKNNTDKYYIFRVASLFGKVGPRGKGKHFIEKIIDKAKNKEEIKVVSDIVMSPTYTKDAASKFKEVIRKDLPSGIYHITNSGYCSWYEFAKEIVRLLNLDIEIKPISYKDFKSKAARPLFSALASSKLKEFDIEPLPAWKEALIQYLKEKEYIN